uniref:MarR family winged helix-turn-helix transcriptional regulator n=1 Tax=Streptomyces sp. NPDC095614 TaxID=3156692 RepID=UPI003319A847
LDSGTLTPMLKRMEQNGLINRERSQEDERSVMVSLTEQDSSLKEKAACIPLEIVKLANKEPEEFKQLKNSLAHLLQQLAK